LSRWLSIVSSAIAVFPVCRSPTISFALAAPDGDERIDDLDAG